MSISLRRFANVLAFGALILLASAAALHLIARYSGVDAASFASLRLVDQNGAARSLEGWRGKIVVLDFIFTECGDVCPLKTAQLAGVQAALQPELRRRIQFVSVSVDPEHDDPAALRAYAARTGADLSDWSFLTGRLDDVARFTAAFDATAGGDVPLHITTIRLLDPSGQVVQRLTGEPVDEPRLTREITELSAAAAPAR